MSAKIFQRYRRRHAHGLEATTHRRQALMLLRMLGLHSRQCSLRCHTQIIQFPCTVCKLLRMPLLPISEKDAEKCAVGKPEKMLGSSLFEPSQCAACQPKG